MPELVFTAFMSDEPEYRCFFSAGQAFDKINALCSEAKYIRIASAYFEASGYELLADVLKNRKVQLMLGRPERGIDQVKEVLNEFLESLNTENPGKRYAAIVSMRTALKNRSFEVNITESGKTTLAVHYLYHHAKLYISEKQVIVTSANFTRQGLVQSREAGYLVENLEDVHWFQKRFDEYWQNSRDITAELLELLENWLKIYSPREIYLRSLIEIYGHIDDGPVKRLPPLAEYQKPVVSRVLHAMAEHDGCMLVAATGLGKTVMAGHIAVMLAADKIIDNAIILSPAGLRQVWSRTMRSARLSSRQFSYHALNTNDWLRNQASALLRHEIDNADESTLLIVDESHHLRNLEGGGGSSLKLAYKELNKAIKKGVKTLLLTATPYSRDITDIHSQLMLVPALNRIRQGDADNFQFGSRGNEVQRVADLAKSTYAVVLAAPTVIKYFSSVDEQGNRYVVFYDDRRMYFPHRMHLETVTYENAHEEFLLELIGSNLLKRKTETDENQPLFDESENRQAGKRDPLFEARLMHQFYSSEAEVESALNKLRIEGGFEKMRFQKQDDLTKKIDEYLAQNSNLKENKKNENLLNIINRHSSEKIVIFCHYQNTTREIYELLQTQYKDRKVVSTLSTDADELERIVQQFAPESNQVPEEQRRVQEEYDLLVATGKLAEGFNLQDAAVLVNFDMPWTVLVLAQRMGRILRPWKVPRDIYIYSLIPDSMAADNPQALPMARAWGNRLDNRSRDYSSFAQLPAFIKKDGRESVEMVNLAKELVMQPETDLDYDQAMEFVNNATEQLVSSSFIDDLARIDKKEKDMLLKLQPGIRSIKPGHSNNMYVLFEYHRRKYAVLFNPRASILHDAEASDRVLGAIRNSDAVPDVFDIDAYEQLLYRCRDTWAASRGIDAAELSIFASMLA